ncbi:MAG: CarD family transcriptional regulator [Clostridia bacterium]|nr:CarD family transcriptional regulator [Clostridia bacterium]
MFEIGDYIIYGRSGVCKVEKIGPIDSMGITNDRIYYTLSPYYSAGSTIFTPADNKNEVMRPVISKDEALQLIDDMKDVETIQITDEKNVENEYKNAIRKCNCTELVKIIKTIYLRKQTRIADGKKITSSDEKYFRMAEDSLYGELAVALGTTREDARRYVQERIEELMHVV